MIDLKNYYKIMALTDISKDFHIIEECDDQTSEFYEYAICIPDSSIDELLLAVSGLLQDNYENFCAMFKADPKVTTSYLLELLGYSSLLDIFMDGFESIHAMLEFYFGVKIEESDEQFVINDSAEDLTEVTLEDVIHDVAIDENIVSEEEPIDDQEDTSNNQKDFDLLDVLSGNEEAPYIPKDKTLELIQETTDNFNESLKRMEEQLKTVTEAVNIINDYKKSISEGYANYLKLYNLDGKFVGFNNKDNELEVLQAIDKLETDINMGNMNPAQLIGVDQMDTAKEYIGNMSPDLCKGFLIDLLGNVNTDKDAIYASHIMQDFVLFARRYYEQFR